MLQIRCSTFIYMLLFFFLYSLFNSCFMILFEKKNTALPIWGGDIICRDDRKGLLIQLFGFLPQHLAMPAVLVGSYWIKLKLKDESSVTVIVSKNDDFLLIYKYYTLFYDRLRDTQCMTESFTDQVACVLVKSSIPPVSGSCPLKSWGSWCSWCVFS